MLYNEKALQKVLYIKPDKISELNVTSLSITYFVIIIIIIKDRIDGEQTKFKFSNLVIKKRIIILLIL